MGPASNSDGERGLLEQYSNDMYNDEQKGISNGVLDEGQVLGSSEENDTRTNEAAKDVDNQVAGTIQVADDQQKTERQLQGPIICWDRFLPFRSLKVLLVENDDSTRHVVSALLRNCSYEVTAVANGFQAWKVLEDLTNQIDLVLTEVALPFISGIGLLYKITNHRNFNNIPVIMMSSHDSMGIVFNCLSKGAVDFLVKPIRKNELKNLWQHVWRRCHSSSGSGSESGTQTKRCTKSKGNDEYENNTGNSDELENGSIGLSLRDGSDDGSGAQSSWTKKAIEVDSPQPTSLDQLADAPDSTCAQVIHIKTETISNRQVSHTEAREFQEEEPFDNIAMGKDLEIGISRKSDWQLEYQSEKGSTQPNSKRQKKLAEALSKPFENGQMEDNSENVSDILWDKAADKDNVIIDCNKPRVENIDFEACNNLPNIAVIKEKASFDSREPMSLELSLKRLRGAGNPGGNRHDDHNGLRYSDPSAFSRYTTGSSTNQAVSGNMGSSSPLDSSSALKRDTLDNHPSQLSSTLLNQPSNGSTNNNDMASTSKHVIPKAEAFSDKSESMSAINCFHSTPFQPVQNSSNCPPHQVKSEKADDVAATAIQVQSISSHKKVQVQHHYHHYHHYHHHYDVQQKDPDDLSHKTMAADASQCGSSNAIGGPMNGNAGSKSVNGSASGSNHESNLPNGSSTASNNGAIKMENDNAVAGNSNADGISGETGGNGAEEDRFAQRRAALTKFRQKRKERCFEKKIRYQSRKQLAEQRPRVRGQFVRQIVCEREPKAGQDGESNEFLSEEYSCDSLQ